MALTRIALAIQLTTSSTCSTITLKDTTADYGGAGKITINSVNSVIIKVNLSGGSYMLYTFTVSSGTITAATLSLSGATATNILSHLTSTVWPFVATQFDLWGSYGVTLPTFADGVVGVEYTVAGLDPNDGTTPFSYTTSSSVLVFCDACCCLQKLFLAIDPDCPCSEESICNALTADAYLQAAKYNVQVGNNTRAQTALDKATSLCSGGCSDC